MIPSTRKTALAEGHKRYFTGTACAQGHIAERRARTGECLACRAEALTVWRRKNPDKVAQHNDAQYKKHTSKIKAYISQWAKDNPVKVLAYTRASQTKRRRRYPKWLTPDDRWMIEQAYELAALRTKMFGFRWQVDHVVPLQGENVSGLHVPANLQVIPWRDNAVKGNRFWVT